MQTLLSNGAAINYQNRYGNTALHIAAKKGNFEVVKALVEKGANTTIKNNDGKTALDLAIESNNRNEEIINYLRNKPH